MVFLASVTREGRPQVLRQSRLVEELDKFLSLWLLASAFIGEITIARVRCSSPAARARIAASMIGTKKQRDFPEPVPVVTAKLCRAIAFATACI